MSAILNWRLTKQRPKTVRVAVNTAAAAFLRSNLLYKKIKKNYAMEKITSVTNHLVLLSRRASQLHCWSTCSLIIFAFTQRWNKNICRIYVRTAQNTIFSGNTKSPIIYEVLFFLLLFILNLSVKRFIWFVLCTQSWAKNYLKIDARFMKMEREMVIFHSKE